MRDVNPALAIVNFVTDQGTVCFSSLSLREYLIVTVSSISLTPTGFIMIPLLIRNVSAPFPVCFAVNEYSNNGRIRFL